MRSAPFARVLLCVTWLAGMSCVSLDEFEGQRFACSSHDDCPDGSWCHLKRLVSGGEEPGNICVPRGDHYCRGQACVAEQRCSDTSSQGPSPMCVPCPGCEPWRDGQP